MYLTNNQLNQKCMCTRIKYSTTMTDNSGKQSVEELWWHQEIHLTSVGLTTPHYNYHELLLFCLVFAHHAYSESRWDPKGLLEEQESLADANGSTRQR